MSVKTALLFWGWWRAVSGGEGSRLALQLEAVPGGVHRVPRQPVLQNRTGCTGENSGTSEPRGATCKARKQFLLLLIPERLLQL